MRNINEKVDVITSRELKHKQNMKTNKFLSVIFSIFCIAIIINTTIECRNSKELLELKKESLRLEIELLKLKLKIK